MFRRSPAITHLILAGAIAPLSVGCASGQGAQSPIGSSDKVNQSEARAGQHEADSVEAPAEDVVLKAARGFTGFRLKDQLQLSDEELFTYLAAADAVCIGERHDVLIDHFAQLKALDAFEQRRAVRGFELGFALEMVQSDAQYPLTEYLEGRLDRDQFVSQSMWDNYWGFPVQYYDPQLRFASYHGFHGIALGVPKALTHHIAQKGLAAVSESDQRRIPPLNLDDAAHRELFDSLMGNHPMPDKADVDYYYQAQVVWDESMAKRSRDWLVEHRPLRKLLIFAGVAHCHRTAIPQRMERDGELVVVNLISAQNSPNQDKDDLLYQGYDYQIVFH